MEKRQSLQQMLLGEPKQDPCSSPCTTINSKWIKDLNITPETLKLVQDRVSNTVEPIDIGEDFVNRTQEAQQLRERNNNGTT
jgi:hypothetical protein